MLLSEGVGPLFGDPEMSLRLPLADPLPGARSVGHSGCDGAEVFEV